MIELLLLCFSLFGRQVRLLLHIKLHFFLSSIGRAAIVLGSSHFRSTLHDDKQRQA